MSRRDDYGAAMAAGRTMLGMLQTHPNLAFAELAGMCGYDFLVLDAEHGLFSDLDLAHALEASEASGMLRLVRPRARDLTEIGRYLDVGADGIIAPNIRSANDARALVAAAYYPPAGTRGFGASAHRVSRYGLDIAAHRADPRAGALLIALIESRQGAANAADIAAIEGIDALFIGPADLSADLGEPGMYNSHVYAEAVGRIEAAAKAASKFLGAAPHPGNDAQALAKRGHQMLIAGYDMPLVREAMLSQLKDFRLMLGG